jgi:CheY-like chemotaxis protein
MSLANALAQPFSPPQTQPRAAEPALLRLAERETFTADLRETLQSLLDLCAFALEKPISESLNEFEKQLVRLADKATITQQNLYFDSVHELKRRRGEVGARFLLSLEDALAHLGQDRPLPRMRAAGASNVKLALTESTHLDESLVLTDIATKVELRVREPLYALGHRFGALAGTARVATPVMPLGPRSVAEALRYATAQLDLTLEHRLMLYRCFERVVMNQIGTLYVAFNNCLIERDVLPRLHTLPTENGSAPTTSVTALASAGAPRLVGVPSGKPHLPGYFGTLRQLLSECRRAETYTASSQDLQEVLAALQACQGTDLIADCTPQLRSGEDIKRQILALLHERCADGRTPCIREEDLDTIDLSMMLFEFLSRRARSAGMVNWVLAKLQLPILRAALKDKAFFADPTHCARRLLNDFAEACQFWVDENETATDPSLIEKLQSLTNQVVSEYQGDDEVLAAVLQGLSQQIQTLARRVEVSERRHIDAAAGREKLERSRLAATAAINERMARNKPSEFLRTLLERGWADVLTVTLLRDGEGSAAYARRLDVVDQLLGGAQNLPRDTLLAALRAEVESGLAQVGLHDDDIGAIGRRLFASAEAVPDENPISQTELAFKLRLKPRLGGEASAVVPETSSIDDIAALAPNARAAFEQLCTVAPGTWFEFIANSAGDTFRRKLVWHSQDTGRCLFVNPRGVPSADISLPELARQMAGERARIATTEREALIDSAWAAICGTLGNFSGRKQGPQGASTTGTGRGSDQITDRPTQEPTPQPQELRTLLLVDDEVNIQRALTRLLRNEGYRILCASSAHEAMAILAKEEVQVVVSDQRMPQVSGTELLTQVKAIYPNTVRILLSGYSDAVAITDAINRGAIYKFLVKPWDDDDIRMQVREAFLAQAVH